MTALATRATREEHSSLSENKRVPGFSDSVDVIVARYRFIFFFEVTLDVYTAA